MDKLHLAAMKKNSEAEIIAMHATGQNLNVKDYHGTTALHIATEFNYLNNVKVLLRCGANVRSRDCTGFEPVHTAARKGYEGILIELISFCPGIINATTDYGATPLHLACERQHSSLVSFLISRGAQVP